jgi:hypothetical protein
MWEAMVFVKTDYDFLRWISLMWSFYHFQLKIYIYSLV